jgi:hypothetical protein
MSMKISSVSLGLIICFGILFQSHNLTAAEEGENKLQNYILNGSFENDAEHWEDNIGREKGAVGVLSFIKDPRFHGKVMKYEHKEGHLCFSQYIKGLEINEKYIYTGYMKGDVRDGRRVMAWIMSDWNNAEVTQRRLNVSDEWVRFAEVFELKKIPRSTELGISVFDSSNTVYYAEPGLYKYSDYIAKYGDDALEWRNVLFNGGFEEANVPELPDGWFCDFIWPDVTTVAHLSSKNPYAGNYCVELKSPRPWVTKTGKSLALDLPHFSSFSNEYLAIKKGDKFRLSFYARSEPAGQKMSSSLQWFNRSPDFTVTDTWKCYVYEGTAEKTLQRGLSVIFHKPDDPEKTLYLDNVSLELLSASDDKVKTELNPVSSGILKTLKVQEPMNEEYLISDHFSDYKTGVKARYGSKVYGFATPESLFFKFVFSSDDPISIPPVLTDRDDKNIYSGKDYEFLELFIQVEDGVYHHFISDATGNKFDQVVKDGLYDTSWNGLWTVKSTVNGNQWEAIVEIPHADYNAGKRLPKDLRINLCREVPGKNAECSAWSPTYGAWFHTPSRFGTLRFSDETVLNERLLSLVSLEFSREPEKNAALLRGAFTGDISDGCVFSAIARGKEYRAPLVKADQRWEGNVLLPSDITIEDIQISSVFGSDNQVMFRSFDKNLIREPKRFLLYCDKSFYNYESKAVITLVAPIGEKNKTSGKLNIKWSVSGTDLKGEQECISPETKFDIPLTSFPSGTSELSIVVSDSSGKKVYKNTHNLTLISSTIKASCKIDHGRLCMEVNGVPRIISSMRIDVKTPQSLKYKFNANWESYIDAGCDFIAELSSLGFDTVFISTSLDSGAENLRIQRKIMDATKENGLSVILAFSPDFKLAQEEKMSFERYAQRLVAIIKNLKDYDNIIAYNMVDEPDLEWWVEESKYKSKFEEADLQKLYEICRKEIPHLPIFINYNHRWVRRFFGGKAATDIYSFDRYVFGCGSAGSFTGSEWEKEESFLRHHSRLDRKPFGNWIQCCVGYSWAIVPNARQMLYQGYFSLLNEAYLIYNFTFHLRPESKETLRGCKQFNEECRILEAILLDGESVDIDFSDNAILSLTKRYKNKIYILTLNPSLEKRTATIRLNSLSIKSTNVDVLFEGRKVNMTTPQEFTELYEPLERHVYCVEAE